MPQSLCKAYGSYHLRFLHRKVFPFQVSSICVATCRRFKMGSPSAPACSRVGGDEEWKVLKL